MMKTKILFTGAALVLSALSCTKDKVESLPQGEKYELAINIDTGAETKVDANSADNAVNNVQVMVYNSSGLLESAGNFTSTSGSLSVSPGTKTVYAVANIPTSKHSFLTSSASDILSTATALTDNAIGGGFVMVGLASANVNGASSVTVPLTRVAAKVELGSVKLTLNGALAGKTLKITQVYLQNAVVNNNLSGNKVISVDDFVNKLSFQTSSFDSYVKTDYSSSNTIADGNVSNGFTAKYYCYPNSTQTDTHEKGTFTARKTRLVIKAELNGRVTYYPVTFGPIEMNKYYKVTNLTITGYGVDDPEQSADKYSLTATVQVNEWGKGSDISPTI